MHSATSLEGPQLVRIVVRSERPSLFFVVLVNSMVVDSTFSLYSNVVIGRFLVQLLAYIEGCGLCDNNFVLLSSMYAHCTNG